MGFDVKLTDNSQQVLSAIMKQKVAAMEAIGEQAITHAQFIITLAGRVESGEMRRKIDKRVAGNDLYIGTNIEHSVYHELGTGIYASQGGGRKTPWSYVDRKGVRHWTRGVKPLHFLKRSVEEHVSEFKAILEKYLSK